LCMEIWPNFDDNLLIDCLIIGRLFCTVGVHPTHCKVDFLYSFGIFTCSGLDGSVCKCDLVF
jgi:hypothetical protein